MTATIASLCHFVEGHRTMRAKLLAGVLLCATSSSSMAARSAPIDEVAISLSRGVDDGRPVLVATITNRSTREICFEAEVLRNPATWDVNVELRDSTRRPIRRRTITEFLIPPLTGVVSIDPASSERARYYLGSRFRLLRTGALPRQRFSARISLNYRYCDNPTPRRATSPWQPI
jgi:hypothetical protein